MLNLIFLGKINYLKERVNYKVIGSKYRISGFNYGAIGIPDTRETNLWIAAAFWFAMFSFKYDGVDIVVRKKE